jgi:alpha-beta hydrolase superfamily lysophospholipase
MRRVIYFAGIVLVLVPVLAAIVGMVIGPRIIRPANLNPERSQQTAAMLERTGAKKEDFAVQASDGVVLRGWKVHPQTPSGDWVLLFHGVSDNRTGMLGAGELLLRHHFSLVMMDARAHGKSGGEIATYGWKERFDSVAIVQALCSTERVRHLYALGASMGGAIALQSAAVEPRVEAVVAEAPFASLREVSYDYAGLEISPLLGKTLLRPASFFALRKSAQAGQFDPDDVSPESAVGHRAFAVLLICGTKDRTIPCRHSQRIYRAAIGPKELWIVKGAEHAAVLGKEPREYEDRVVSFLERN